MAALGGRLLGIFRTRAALGLRPVTAPVVVFIPAGFVLGPFGTGLISQAALRHLDVVISIALATLGVLIGIAVGTERGSVRRLLGASSLEALITISLVGGSIWVLLGIWRIPLTLSYGLTALALGICASASAAPSVTAADEHARQVAARVADLDDVLPILVGAGVIALVAPSVQEAPLRTVLPAGAGLAIAASGWLLFERAEGAERNVFVLGTLALLGGCAAYAGTSPLLAGLAAGWFWARTSGHADRVVARELAKVQHPLVVLLLIAAGAALEPSVAGVWLFAPYVVFRVAGKLIGGWAASKVAPGIAPSDLGAYLIPPGVIGIAFALNVQQAASGGADALLFAAASGAIASELLALVVTPVPQPA